MGLIRSKIKLIRIVCKVDSVVFQPVLTEQDPIDVQDGAFVDGSSVEVGCRQVVTEYLGHGSDHGTYIIFALDEYA